MTADGETGPAPTVTVALACDDARGLIRWLAHDTDWGRHELGVRDPVEGNLWAVGTYRPPVAGS